MLLLLLQFVFRLDFKKKNHDFYFALRWPSCSTLWLVFHPQVTSCLTCWLYFALRWHPAWLGDLHFALRWPSCLTWWLVFYLIWPPAWLGDLYFTLNDLLLNLVTCISPWDDHRARLGDLHFALRWSSCLTCWLLLRLEVTSCLTRWLAFRPEVTSCLTWGLIFHLEVTLVLVLVTCI